MKVLYWSGRQLKRISLTLLILGLTAIVVGMGVAQFWMKQARENPQVTAQWLSKQAGVPLHLDSIETKWTREGPVMQVRNLRLSEGEQELRLGDAQLILAMYSGWMPGRAFSQLRLSGLHLELVRSDDGRWTFVGLPQTQNTDSDPLAQLSRLGELQIVNGSLTIDAPSIGLQTKFPKANLRLSSDERRFSAGMRAWSELSPVPIDAAIDYDRVARVGNAWVGSRGADLSAWTSLLKYKDVQIEKGNGNVDAWLSVANQRVTRITGKLDIKDFLARKGVANVDADIVGGETRAFDRIQATGAWVKGNGTWRLMFPSLSLERNGVSSKMDDMLIAAGDAQAFQAKQINGQLVADVATFVPWLSDNLRNYLRAAKPSASVSDVLFVRKDGQIQKLEGNVEDLRLLPALGHAGIDGLSADVSRTGQSWVVNFRGRKASALTLPGVFDKSFAIRPKGSIDITQSPNELIFKTSRMEVDIDGYPFVFNGSVVKNVQDALPFLNVTATANRFPINKAKMFWVRNHMPQKALNWLDPAFVSGDVRDLNATFVGNPQHWPFGPGRGLLATGRIENGVIHFAEGWPNATGLNANLRFENDGFEVKGKGYLDKIPVDDILVSIDHYNHGSLKIRAGASTDGSNGIALLQKSPIAKYTPETFANLKVAGNVRSGFALDLPLVENGQLKINGIVDFLGNRIQDARYKVEMNNVRGRGIYTNTGFLAKGLNVVQDGKAGTLDVRVGNGHVQNPGNIVEVALDSSISTGVIDRYTTALGWLKPYMVGDAKWHVQVNVPSQERGAKSTNLSLRSDLVGMQLLLPEPMKKPANVALPTSIEIPLPLDNQEMTLRFGNRAAMKILERNGESWIRVALGSNNVVSPNAPGLTVEGSSERVSALDWIAVAKSDSPTPQPASSGKPLRLNRIDVQANHLYLLGGDFRNTRVVLQPQRNGDLVITANGPWLSGTVVSPKSAAAPLRGTFDRVEFHNDGLTEQQANVTLSRATAQTRVGQEVQSTALNLSNPANLPPLQFSTQSLKVGSISFGAASFESIPTVNGMRMTKIRAQHPAYTIDGTGLWTSRAGQAQTQLSAVIATTNAGAAVAAFGAPNQVEGGKGQLALNVGWNGGPEEFSVEKLTGQMNVDLKEGRIPEVEPGVGRVLGLLSIAELPRRLTLDFRDFFDKGLRFNSIKGEVNLGNGLATAKDFRIEAAAAHIQIEGSSDLRNERFNQIVTVEPRAGGLLTAIGAVAGGPIGAAVGAAANAILQKPIGQMAAKKYHVTGPWKNPDVKVLPKTGN